MKCILLFLSLVCSLSVSAQYCSEVWSPDNGDGTYTNPVINADYSDPDVVAVGDDYYLTEPVLLTVCPGYLFYTVKTLLIGR